MPHEVTLPAGETFSISVAPVRGADNQMIGRVAVLQDITAIKELEQREQERLRDVLRRYVSPTVVEQVLALGSDSFAWRVVGAMACPPHALPNPRASILPRKGE